MVLTQALEMMGTGGEWAKPTDRRAVYDQSGQPSVLDLIHLERANYCYK